VHPLLLPVPGPGYQENLLPMPPEPPAELPAGLEEEAPPGLHHRQHPLVLLLLAQLQAPACTG
jgi:hypothetical protein